MANIDTNVNMVAENQDVSEKKHLVYDDLCITECHPGCFPDCMGCVCNPDNLY